MSSNKKYCNVCGTENPPKANFCSSCGAKLGKHEKNSGKVKNQHTNNEKQLNINVIVLSLAGLIAVGLILLYLGGVFDSPTINTTQFNSNAGGQAVQQQNNPHAGVDLNQLQQIKDMEVYVANNPDDLLTLLKLAHLLNDSGFYAKAIERYQQYLSKKPDVPDVLIDMGVCYFELKQYDKAITNMKRAIEINPNHQIGLFNLGIVNSAIGNLQEAKKWWQKSYEINPNADIAQKAKKLINQN